MALVTFALADGFVAAQNYRHYGIFETTEMRANNFVRAYGALSRIRHDHWRPFVPFPKDARERAYSVSSAAREIKPYLEGDIGKGWLATTCSATSVKPCDEVRAGWAMWEFRNAVAAAGHYKSGADAMNFYGTLADQINSACDANVIPCLPPRATLQPPFRREYWQSTLDAAKVVVPIVFEMEQGPVGSQPSIGSAAQIALFSDTVAGVYMPERPTIVVNGWVAALTAAPTLRVEAQTHDPFEFSTTPIPDPGLLTVFPTHKPMRFALRSDCPVASCDLVIDVAGAGQSRIPLSWVVQTGGMSGFSPLFPD